MLWATNIVVNNQDAALWERTLTILAAAEMSQPCLTSRGSEKGIVGTRCLQSPSGWTCGSLHVERGCAVFTDQVLWEKK